MTVYGPHHAAPVDEYQVDPHNEEGRGPLLEQGVVPDGGSGQHEWVHSQHGEPINNGYADSAPEALAAGQRSHAELTGGWDPGEILGANGTKGPLEVEHRLTNNGLMSDEDMLNQIGSEMHDPHGEWVNAGEHEARIFQAHYLRKAGLKTAWSGWGPALIEPERHAAKGWDWDDHLSAYIANKPRKFTCSCGQQHPAVGYSNCKCGKIWNGYVIGTGGDRHEASAEKFLVREIPVRDGIIVANRQLVAEDDPESLSYQDHGHSTKADPGGWGNVPEMLVRKRLEKTEPYRMPEHYLPTKVRENSRHALTLGVPQGGYDWEDEAAGSDPWPSDHHPPAGDATMSPQPDDWHHREKGKFTPGHKPGPGVFRKQDR